MELCSGGNLYEKISSDGLYKEETVAVLMGDILRVAEQCHAKGVIHRDIKPENFLFQVGVCGPGRSREARRLGTSALTPRPLPETPEQAARVPAQDVRLRPRRLLLRRQAAQRDQRDSGLHRPGGHPAAVLLQ